LGIGDWVNDDKIRVRIITEQTGTIGNKFINALIHFNLPPDKLITAVNSQEIAKPHISFEGSSNIKNFEYNLPIPVRLITANRDDWSVYVREIAIPVTIELKDDKTKLDLKAQVEVMICDQELKCKTKTFEPVLKLDPIFNYNSAVATYVQQQTFYSTPAKNQNITIKKAVIEKTDDIAEILKIIIRNNKKVSAFEIFVSNNDNIKCEQPRASIDGKEITVRILPLNYQDTMVNKEFELTMLINKEERLRTHVTPTEIVDTTAKITYISVSLFIMALLGGFLLNLMPCVFPVLSLKLLSLTKFGARNHKAVRHNFFYTLLGIYISFAILAAILAILKYAGHNIGWGMQFQNPVFLIIMIFALILFILQIMEVINIRTPKFANNILSKSNKDSFLHFLTGIFVVLMATPCTAPYLGTAIGFALAGTIPEMFIILFGVALGLSLPYIILFLMPSLIIFVPTPGNWMQKVNNIMTIMLIITLGWLFTVLLTQTSLWLCMRLCIYCSVFIGAIWLSNINNEMDYKEPDKNYEKIFKKAVNIIMLSIAGLFTITAAIDTTISHKKHYEEIAQITRATIRTNEINKLLKEKKTVLVIVGADWCLTCKYNNAVVFKNPAFISKVEQKGIEIINIDWTNYDAKVLEFMSKYGRSGLPFYVIFSPVIPDGMVLPEILTEKELVNIIDNISF
jgi:suppressor for copper-sensitivity B